MTHSFMIPAKIETEHELEAFMAQPYPETVEMMTRVPGDIIILGVAGKMGPSVARLAVNAIREAGVKKRVIGVSRFSEAGQRENLESAGVETVACDLSDMAAVEKLPRAENVLFLAGRKFGSVGSEALTWIMNVIVPANVARTFTSSRIVAFSTGCVYPLVAADTGGCTEADPAAPIGEYANSCLGRERIFEHYAVENNTPALLYRLNYAIDLRYGVLADIAWRIQDGAPVDVNVGAANVIWQGDAVNRALLCLERAAVPAVPLNITGAETISVPEVAKQLGRLLNKPVDFTGSDAGKYYLSNASKSVEWFDEPRVSVDRMVRWVAEWVKRGGKNLGKPTHFSVTDGQFLD